MIPVRRILAIAAVATGTLLVSGHIGSPNVFFTGKAGAYEVRVVIRPPQVVPGVATVTVRTTEDVERVSIRPVYWRAGSRGAPSADETRRLAGDARTFEGSLWLMTQGAYTVDVIVDGSRGVASVLVPIGAAATGRLDMSSGLAALLVVLGAVLCAGLVNIVYKGAGEALVPMGTDMDTARRRRARRVAALSLPVIGLALLGGARWWSAVDEDYRRDLYRPSPLVLHRDGSALHVQLSDTVWQRGVSPLVPDHGKLMHLFLVRAEDARAFAHLHPVAVDSSAVPDFRTALPPLPAGDYHAFGDVVHETGFERTLVGTLTIPTDSMQPWRPADSDDGWFVGDASRENTVTLADGARMRLELVPDGIVEAGRDQSIRLSVTNARGEPARLEPYLGMAAHAVIVKVDGSVYVHLHPMGTVTSAAREVFEARDRGDTTASGRVTLAHAMHAMAPDSVGSTVEFPYAFPSGGSYRLFAQVKRGGRILTGAWAVTVAERPDQGR
ncbi:MAG TPA: hypothetical protein VFO66_14365 [Gemmatimonadaceae bacterium]|nr:hypothetical protein [Gemmatimonadaceae bacterium]